MSEARAQFLRFCLVGGIGFIVDAGTTLLLVKGLHVSPSAARVAAFVAASSATWALNRRYTFRSTGGVRSWLAYVACMTLGSLVNFAVYAGWLHWAGTSALQILAGVALGSIAGLAFNFGFAKRVIFRPQAPAD